MKYWSFATLLAFYVQVTSQKFVPVNNNASSEAQKLHSQLLTHNEVKF